MAKKMAAEPWALGNTGSPQGLLHHPSDDGIE
jgi:hypothetical protein